MNEVDGLPCLSKPGSAEAMPPTQLAAEKLSKVFQPLANVADWKTGDFRR